MFFENEVDLLEVVASCAMVCVVVLVVRWLVVVSAVVIGRGDAVLIVSLSWFTFAVFLEVVVDILEEHECFLEFGFLFVFEFGFVGKDLEYAA